MAEQGSGKSKLAWRWARGLAIYCATLFLILLGMIFLEFYPSENASIALLAYEQPAQAQDAYLIGINTATVQQLETLPSVGPVLSGAIVSHRTEHGPFHSLEQLLEVSGIGEKTLELIRPLIYLD